MSEKKIYLHHERSTTAGALNDIQNREIVYTSEIDYLVYKTAGSDDRYALTMSTNAMSESAGVITFPNAVLMPTSLNIGSTIAITGVLDEDAMGSDSAVKLCTQQSIKAYVDAQVATVDTWAEVLANGNTSGANDVVIDSGQSLLVDTTTLAVNMSGYADLIGMGTATPTAGVDISLYFTRGGNDSIGLSISGAYDTNTAHPCKVESSHPLATGKALAVFDADATTTGANDLDHIANFQARASHDSSGTLGNMYGFYGGCIGTGGIVGNSYGIYVTGFSGAGQCDENYGVFLDVPAKGNNNDWGLYQSTNNRNYLNGSLGIGGPVTFEAWNSSYNALQIGSNASTMATRAAGSAGLRVDGQNFYYDGSWKRQDIGYTSCIKQEAGEIVLRVSGTDSADSVITWVDAVTIEADGDVVMTQDLHVTQDLKVSGDDIDDSNGTWISSDGAGNTGLAGNLFLADGATLGPASDPDSMTFEADGDVVFSQDIYTTASKSVYFPDGGGFKGRIYSAGSGNITITHDSGSIYLSPSGSIFVGTDTKMLYRDSAIGIYSQADTFLDMFADGAVRIGNSAAGGSPTTYLSISPGGDLVFVGAGSGVPYAEIYAYNVASTITIAASGVANKVQVTSFAVNGPSNQNTPDHTNDHITIDTAGIYEVSCSISFESTGGTAYLMAFGAFKNNGATQFTNLHFHRNLSGGGSDHGAGTMTGLIDVAATDTIEIWCWNDTNTNNVVVDDINLSLVQIGGT